MNFKNKQKLLTVLVILLANTVFFAQNIEGKAYYISKTNTELDFSDREGMPEEIKQRIKQQMKDLSTKTFVLSFNASESLYQEETELDNSSLSENRFGGGLRMIMSAQDAGILYKNTKNKSYTNQKDVYGKQFIIQDSLKTFDWKLENESKKVGNYLCFKATTTMKMLQRPSGFPGNPNSEKDEAPTLSEKEELVTVWYTLDIPLQQGPEKLWGLPGLILEVEMGNKKILCTKVEVSNNSKTFNIEPPKKGKKVNQETFDEILAKKIKELQASFGGQRGGAFRRGNRN